MSRAGRIRDMMRDNRINHVRDCIERACKRQEWHALRPRLIEAFRLEKLAREAMRENSTDETRRKYLAAKMYRLSLDHQRYECWQ